MINKLVFNQRNKTGREMFTNKLKYFSFIIISFLILTSSINAQGKFLKGMWTGTLNISTLELRVVFNISREKGKYKATMDSPDQGAKDVPVDEIIIEGKTATFKVNVANAKFVGEFNEDSTQIIGKWIQ